MVFEKNVWWNHCVPFFPQTGRLVPVLVLFSPLVKGGLLLPTWRDPHSAPAPLLKQEKETTERLIKKRVREKVAWKRNGGRYGNPEPHPPWAGPSPATGLSTSHSERRVCSLNLKQGLYLIYILVELHKHISSLSTDCLSRDKQTVTTDSWQSSQALSSRFWSSPTQLPKGLHASRGWHGMSPPLDRLMSHRKSRHQSTLSWSFWGKKER